MIRSIIVDDEKKCREALRSLLRKFARNVEVVALADSVGSAIVAVNKHKPELVFLDIVMPDGDGFEFLERSPEIDFDIIFTSAYDQYAIKAFKFSAIDYLLKPVSPPELKAAIERAEQKMASTLENEKFGILLENLSSTLDAAHKKIALPTLEGLKFVRVSDIIRCEAAEHYTYFVLKSKKTVFVSRILKEYEDLLSDFNFFRVHHSHLINLEYIEEYVRSGDVHVVMSDGAKIPISKRKKESFIQKIR